MKNTPEATHERQDQGAVHLPEWPPPRPVVRSDRVTPEAAARLPRQTAADTRGDLLDAAERIVNEYVTRGPHKDDPPVDLLPFIRLDEVLTMATELARLRLQEAGNLLPEERVAPLTPGAFYKAFTNENQDKGRGGAIVAFRRQATFYMANSPKNMMAEPYIQWGKQLHEQGFKWSEVVRLGVEADFDLWADTPALILISALAFHARDPDVAKLASERDEQDLAKLTKVYEALLPIFGRRMRRGLTVAQMATIVSDLVAGMALRSRFSEERRRTKVRCDFDGTGEKDWHLSACAALAIYERFTEPV